jgi:hypothetical protein
MEGNNKTIINRKREIIFLNEKLCKLLRVLVIVVEFFLPSLGWQWERLNIIQSRKMLRKYI